MAALKGYELTPDQRDEILFCVRQANFRYSFLSVERINRSIVAGESARFSEMSLSELYELAWAAGDLALKPPDREELAKTSDSFQAWYEEEGARLAHDRRTASHWRPKIGWGEALLEELEHRTKTSPRDKAAELEQACARVRTFVEQL